MKPWYRRWQVWTLLFAAALYIPIKIYGTQWHQELYAWGIMILACVILVPHVRGLQSYDPLSFYDADIYTKVRPNVLIVILATIVLFLGLSIIWFVRS